MDTCASSTSSRCHRDHTRATARVRPYKCENSREVPRVVDATLGYVRNPVGILERKNSPKRILSQNQLEQPACPCRNSSRISTWYGVIPRALETWPDIDLIDDRRGCQFKAVIHRPAIGNAQPESQPESMEDAVLRILMQTPASKAEISQQLGLKQISGQAAALEAWRNAESSILPYRD